jgi:hypothetical protein
MSHCITLIYFKNHSTAVNTAMRALFMANEKSIGAWAFSVTATAAISQNPGQLNKTHQWQGK